MKKLKLTLCLMLFVINYCFCQVTPVNYKLSFNGVSDFFRSEGLSNLDLGKGDFTIEGQLEASQKTPATDQTILSNKNFHGDGFTVGITSSGNMYIELNSLKHTFNHSAGPLADFFQPELHCSYFAIVRHDKDLTLYINGIFCEVISTAIVEDITTHDFYFCGMEQYTGTSSAYKGCMDDIRVWSTAQSASEIQSNINNCLSTSKKINTLLIQWRFDQEPMSVIYDFAEGDNQGEIINFNSEPPYNDPQFRENTCSNSLLCSFFEMERLADPNCIQDQNTYLCGSINLVCNGDFEQGVANPNLIQHQLSFGGCSSSNASSAQVTNWCGINNNGVPDYYGRGNMVYPQTIPVTIFNSPNGPIDTWDTPNPANNRFIGALVSPSNIFVPNNGTQAAITHLVSPVLTNKQYILTYKIFIAGNNPFFPGMPSAIRVRAELVDDYPTSFPYNTTHQTFLTPFSNIIPGDGNWHDVTIAFTYTGSVPMEELVPMKWAQVLGSYPYFYRILYDDVKLFEVTNGTWPKVEQHGFGVGGSGRSGGICTDLAGNVYATGFIDEPSYFDGNFRPRGLYVVSYDPCGNIRWLNGVPNWYGKDITYDPVKDQLYVTGKTDNNVPFVQIYNPATGVLGLLHTFNSSFNNYMGCKLLIDNANTSIFYVVLNNGGTASRIQVFDDNLNVVQISSSIFPDDIYSIAQLPGGGNLVLPVNDNTGHCEIRQCDKTTIGASINNVPGLGTRLVDPKVNMIFDITADQLGNVYFTGYNIQSNISLGKYDPSSHTIDWYRKYPNAYTARGYSVTTDGVGNPIIAGEVYGISTFGSITLTNGSGLFNNQGSYSFLLKCDASGNEIWAQNGWSTADGTGTDVVYKAPFCYLHGYSMGTVHFGSATIVTTGCDNNFIARLLDSGTQGDFMRVAQDQQPTSNTDNSALSISPNPSDGDVKIKWNGKNPINISILDISGRKVYSSTCYGELIVQGLETGLYIVAAEGTGIKDSKKLIIY